MADPPPHDLEAGGKELQPGSPCTITTTTTLQDGSVQSHDSLIRITSPVVHKWTQKLKTLLPGGNGTRSPQDDTVCTRQPQSPVRQLEQCPMGYPRLAAFHDSDENFMMYRRFGYVWSRLLLHKESRLERLEQSLDDMDAADISEDAQCLMNSDFADDEDTPRAQLFRDLEQTAREYAELLNHAKELTATSRPSKFEYRSVCNYVRAEPRKLMDDDEPSYHLREDMITLRPGREHAWLDEAIEHCLRFFHCRSLHNLFCSKETRQKTDGTTGVIYYTRTRINLMASAIITIAILALLVAPIYVLYHLTNSTEQGPRNTAVCIGTLIIFILAFSAVLSFFTRARRHEILGAAAAYAAVLVVFLSSVPLSTPLTR